MEENKRKSMIERIKIEHFRGFRELELPDLKQINLITGRNNSGKTSVLEAIFLYFDHPTGSVFAKLNLFRGIQEINVSPRIWESLFYHSDLKDGMRIHIDRNGSQSELCYTKETGFLPVNQGNFPADFYAEQISSVRKNYSLRFDYSYGSYTETGHFVASQTGISHHITTNAKDGLIQDLPHVQYINARTMGMTEEVVSWVGQMELAGKKARLIDIVRIIEPDCEDLLTVSINGESRIYMNTSSGILPLHVIGDGVFKLLYIAMALMIYPDSIILIDEIENGFHYSMYEKVWELIRDVAKAYRCQVMITSHSYECIEAASKMFAKDEEFCLFRIQRKDGMGKSYRYSEELLQAALDAQMEVR